MPDTKSMILFVSCWLLLAVVSLPSGASAAPGPVVSDTGSTSDAFPRFENTFAAGKAGLTDIRLLLQPGKEMTRWYPL